MTTPRPAVVTRPPAVLRTRATGVNDTHEEGQ
jgi:hypothetical protein